MTLPTTYNTGTASIAAGDTAVIGQGTTWLTSGVQPGQQIVSNPTDGLLEGETVKPQQDKTQDVKSSG